MREVTPVPPLQTLRLAETTLNSIIKMDMHFHDNRCSAHSTPIRLARAAALASADDITQPVCKQLCALSFSHSIRVSEL